MKTTNLKILSTVVLAVLFGVATLISSLSRTNVLAFEKPRPPATQKGNDPAIKDEKCERIDTPKSSTYGKCGSVCKDLDITGKDRTNNRFLCKAKPTVLRPTVKLTSGLDLTLDPSPGTNPKPAAPGGSNAGKSKQ